MIDWSKERSDKNYCGYCNGTPPTGFCDGTCFSRKDYPEERRRENKKDHLETQLKEIPQLREKLDKREQDLKDALKELT
jgi:hypothetical protein